MTLIEWIFSHLVQLVSWLWTSAMTLYYLAGFFVVAGGFVIFTATVVHELWKRGRDQRPMATDPQPGITVHVENLNMTLELTEPQLRSLIADQDLSALPAADSRHEDEGTT